MPISETQWRGKGMIDDKGWANAEFKVQVDQRSDIDGSGEIGWRLQKRLTKQVEAVPVKRETP